MPLFHDAYDFRNYRNHCSYDGRFQSRSSFCAVEPTEIKSDSGSVEICDTASSKPT